MTKSQQPTTRITLLALAIGLGVSGAIAAEVLIRLDLTRVPEAGREVIEVRGATTPAYEIAFGAGGGIELRFPGAMLVADPSAAGLLLAQAPDGARLSLPAGSRLLGVSSDTALLRLTLAGMADVGGETYRIGIGDKLRLVIYGDDEFKEREVRVVGDGTISLPYIGDVQVAGRTSTEVAEDLTKRFAAGFLVNPKLSLEVVEYQSQWVNVAGEVEKPGRYYLKEIVHLKDIIAQAGGLTREAGTEIRVTRPRGAGEPDEVLRVRRDVLYLTDDPSADPPLRSGDTVTVTAEEFFFIRGEVRNPGRYAIAPETTILKAISLAGGFEQYANRKKIEVLRQQGASTVRLEVNVERVESRKEQDIPVLPGDIINVKARFL